jgi:hypothetical protein
MSVEAQYLQAVELAELLGHAYLTNSHPARSSPPLPHQHATRSLP